MKRIILTVFALLTIGSIAFGYDIKVENITMSNSGKTALMVYMNLGKEEKSSSNTFTFKIKLPDGIEFVVEDPNAEDKDPISKMGSIFPADAAIAGTNILEDGSLSASYALGEKEIFGTKQLIAAFQIQPNASFSANVGDVLTGQVYDKKISDKEDVKYKPEATNFNITVTDRVVLDENSPFAPEATGGNVDILVKRTITANQWSTICLPFDIDKDIFKSIFGSDVQLAAFKSYTYEAESDELSVNFTNDDLSEGFYAGYPYLIKTTQDISEFNLTATISVASEISETWEKGKGSSKKVGKFWGTYSADCVVPENDLFISDNQFYYSRGTTRMKAFRGYFDFTDVLADLSKASTRAIINIGDGTTGIRNAKLEGEETGKVYSMTGQYMGERESLKSLPKGVYIIDGKKVINK